MGMLYKQKVNLKYYFWKIKKFNAQGTNKKNSHEGKPLMPNLSPKTFSFAASTAANTPST